MLLSDNLLYLMIQSNCLQMHADHFLKDNFYVVRHNLSKICMCFIFIYKAQRDDKIHF